MLGSLSQAKAMRVAESAMQSLAAATEEREREQWVSVLAAADNSLPILWARSGEWVPSFPRL